jgi:HEAT repeat protein
VDHSSRKEAIMPRSRTLLALLALFSLSLALGRSTAGAEEPEIKREQLRYDGRSFDDWRHALLTELKASRRIEALNALGAFAAKGYAVEAAEVTIKVMADYYEPFQTVYEDRAQIEEAALNALRSGSDGVNAVLVQGLKGSNRSQKLFILKLLRERDLRFALPVLREVVLGTDKKVANRAVHAMAEKKEKEIRHALEQLYNKGNVEIRCRVVDGHDRGSSDFAYSPLLLVALKDKEARVRERAAAVLSSYWYEEEVVGALVGALDDKCLAVRKEAIRGLHDARSRASQAVPRLRQLLPSEDKEERELAGQAIERISQP